MINTLFDEEVIMEATKLDYLLAGFNILIGIANVYFIYLVFKFTTRDINPKISIIPMRDADPYYDDYNYKNNESIRDIDYNQKGFPDSSLEHKNISWKLKLRNYSDLPAINVRLDYSIVIKKAVYDYSEDCTEVYSHNVEDYKTIRNSAIFVYIAAQSEVIEPLLQLQGEFIEADLIINSLKSDEIHFIKKPIRIDTYKHPDTYELEDSNHYRQFIGAYKPLPTETH